jgi:hypothetical protein
MWYPNRLQWIVLWTTALCVVGFALGGLTRGIFPSLLIGGLLVWQLSAVTHETARDWAKRILVTAGLWVAFSVIGLIALLFTLNPHSSVDETRTLVLAMVIAWMIVGSRLVWQCSAVVRETIRAWRKRVLLTVVAIACVCAALIALGRWRDARRNLAQVRALEETTWQQILAANPVHGTLTQTSGNPEDEADAIMKAGGIVHTADVDYLVCEPPPPPPKDELDRMLAEDVTQWRAFSNGGWQDSPAALSVTHGKGTLFLLVPPQTIKVGNLCVSDNYVKGLRHEGHYFAAQVMTTGTIVPTVLSLQVNITRIARKPSRTR